MKNPQRKSKTIDGRTIQAFLQGSETATRRIYEYFSPAVYGIVASTPLMLEDIRPEIVDEVFNQLWIEKAWIPLNSVEEFRSYLFRVTKNITIEYLQDLHYNQLDWVKGKKEGENWWKIQDCKDCTHWKHIRDKIFYPMQNIEEDLLRSLEQASFGNQDAYKKVCDHFHSIAYRLARKYLKSSSITMIESIINEVFSNMWNERSEFDTLECPLKFEFYLDGYVRSAALKIMN
jgi:DNA-directed RNA polymerase specialized sigma24 family protein